MNLALSKAESLLDDGVDVDDIRVVIRSKFDIFKCEKSFQLIDEQIEDKLSHDLWFEMLKCEGINIHANHYTYNIAVYLYLSNGLYLSWWLCYI